jgi:hypothetical protein
LVQGWDIGYYDVTLHADYDPSMGSDWKVELTSTLDQAPNDESIGIGSVSINVPGAEGDCGLAIPEPVAAICTSDADLDASLWENNCNAFTRHECAGEVYYGGKNECGGGHSMSREFDVSSMATAVEFSARVFTIESWDNE